MQARNVVGDRIDALEQGKVRVDGQKLEIPVQYMQRFIYKNAIAYHPYINFWGNEETWSIVKGHKVK